LDAFSGLDREIDLVNGAKDFVDFADGGLIGTLVNLRLMNMRVIRTNLVLEVYWGIEVWDFGIDRFADNLAFACVEESTHF